MAVEREPDPDTTVEVPRSAGPVDDDATRQLVRSPVDDEATVRMSSRNALPDDEATRSLHRFGAPVAKPVMAPARKRRRGELHPAPVPSGYGERAVRVPGVGTVSSYRPRAIPVPPPARPRTAGAEVVRVAAVGSSVARRSRRFSALAIAGFAASCVVSVVGLALIAGLAFAR